MKLKNILQVGALCVLAQKVAGISWRRRAALFCEDNSGVYSRVKNDQGLVPCYYTDPDPAKRCKFYDSRTVSRFGPYDSPNQFSFAVMYFIQCDNSPQRAGICERGSDGRWRRVSQCTGTGYEAVITLVQDYKLNRRLRTSPLDEDEDHVPFEEHEPTSIGVDIDGETWTIVDAPEDFED
jgi:hypothetical protein